MIKDTNLLKNIREEDFQMARTNKYLYTTKNKKIRIKSRRRKNMTFATTPLSLNLNSLFHLAPGEVPTTFFNYWV